MHRMLALALIFLGASASADLQIELTDERIENGKYLVHRVAGCDGCHTERMRGYYSFPPKQDMLLGGGNIFIDIGPRAITPNITPFGIGDWSDQQVFTAITTGVLPDGRVMDPAMPYATYGRMDVEQIFDIIAYLRSTTPVAAGPYPAEFPGTHEPFRPRFGELAQPPAAASEIERGAYLVEIARCNGCHHGAGADAIADLPYAGGREFGAPGIGIMRAANLTPDIRTGLGGWNRDVFVARFTAMRGSWHNRVEPGSVNTVMHWWQYADMTESDLSAIHAYLQTLTPVANNVIRFEPLPGEIVSRRSWSERPDTTLSAQ